MRKGVISLVLALGIIIVVSVMFNMRGPDVSQYQHLKDPSISIKPSQRMLVVEAKGQPEVIGKKVFGLLMRAYFGIKGIPKGKNMATPRARWQLTGNLPQSEWVGRYAMAVPDTIKNISLPSAPEGLAMQLTTWEYGEVAEILYTGPYDKEEPAIKRLHEFIKDSGYEIAGDHEEEYLRGPGMLIRGDPKNYVTIIRYRIKKAGDR